jgi:predicted MFS family arabinose efflux permease
MVVGGLLVQADVFGTGWRPVFLINVPVGLLVAVLVPRFVPRDGARGTRRLDVVGLITASSAVCLVVVPLVLGHEQNWPLWTFLSLGAGLLMAVAFVVVERRVAARGGDPLLRLDVVRVPGVGTGLSALAAGMIAYGGFLFMFTLHLQGGLGDSALKASLVIAPAGATFGLFGFYWRKFPARIHHLLTPVGFGLAALAYLTIALSLVDGSQGGSLLTFGLLLFGASMGAAFSPLLTNALVRVPLTEAADASGLLTTTVQLGQVIGVAVFGSLFLTLAEHGGSHPSASALGSTLTALAILLALGVVAAAGLTRTVLRARVA